MTCDEAKPLISAYQDGELSPDRRQDIEAHLGDCPACSAVLKRNLNLSQAIRTQAPTYAAPGSLLGPFTQRRRAFLPSFAAGMAAGLAFASVLVFAFLHFSNRDLAADLVSDHVRSLMANHLIDVASSDRHTVKPWFLGKVDFAPLVPDLSVSGYPLVGGRLDYVDGQTAAALVYQKKLHVINVLVMPDRVGASSSEVNGYSVVHWRIGSLGYWAISDLPQQDLAAFADSFRRVAG